ncbi:hypothetical protein ACVRWL_04455 [Streptococcus ratti]|uniref:Uncharacterized protein n=1 Tax=Streptococcus ratti TaxID=1341 RepID=A0A7X9QGJ0_STRRT|nr:hypothetical protein [Streptococcus ratti]NMD48759.1 hypothetical protein [Streptococcus ratti]
MTKKQMAVNLFCFGLLILGAISLMLGYIELGIYSNTLVLAIQSILVFQQILLKNNKEG